MASWAGTSPLLAYASPVLWQLLHHRASPLTPPQIWGTLYGMIGYASHVLVPVADSSPNPLVASVAEHALALYYVQLALNFIYMPIFFLAQRKWLAMGDITVITAMTWKLVVSASHGEGADDRM